MRWRSCTARSAMAQWVGGQRQEKEHWAKLSTRETWMRRAAGTSHHKPTPSEVRQNGARRHVGRGRRHCGLRGFSRQLPFQDAKSQQHSDLLRWMTLWMCVLQRKPTSYRAHSQPKQVAPVQKLRPTQPHATLHGPRNKHDSYGQLECTGRCTRRCVWCVHSTSGCYKEERLPVTVLSRNDAVTQRDLGPSIPVNRTGARETHPLHGNAQRTEMQAVPVRSGRRVTS
jgi:hypothetical protein